MQTIILQEDEAVFSKSPHNRSPLRAGGWAMASFIVTYIISAVLYIPLARFLGPDDFGLYTEATLIYSGLTLVIELGLIRGLVRTPGALEEVTLATFWLAIVFGSIGVLLCVLAGPPMTLLYHSNQLQILLLLLAPGVLAIALGAVPHALLSRDLDYRRKLLPETISTGVGATVALGAAILHAGVYSLIIYTLVRVSLNCVVAWLVVGWKPRFRLPDRIILRELLRFAIPSGLGELALYARFNVDYALTGLRLGTNALGVYSLAWSTSDRPAVLINAFFSNVGYSTFARLHQNPEQHDLLRRIYLGATRLIACVALPIFLSGILVSEDLVGVVLGNRWIGIIGPIFGLFILQAFWVIFYPSANLILALGFSRFYAWVNNASLIVTIILVLFGTSFGTTGVAWAMAFSVGLTSCVWAYLVKKVLKLKFYDFWKVLQSPLILTLFTICALLSAQFLSTTLHLNPILHLCIPISAGLTMLICTTRLFFWSSLREDVITLRGELPV